MILTMTVGMFASLETAEAVSTIHKWRTIRYTIHNNYGEPLEMTVDYLAKQLFIIKIDIPCVLGGYYFIDYVPYGSAYYNIYMTKISPTKLRVTVKTRNVGGKIYYKTTVLRYGEQ